MSVGDAGETTLPKLLTAAGGTPPPFVSVGVDAAQYYKLLGDAMQASDEEEMPEEMRAALSDVFEAAADFYDRVRADVRFTDRGIEVDTDLTLSD